MFRSSASIFYLLETMMSSALVGISTYKLSRLLKILVDVIQLVEVHWPRGLIYFRGDKTAR